MSDLQVETYSSMERREKTEFLLEQMRLLVLVARGKDAEDVKEGKDEINSASWWKESQRDFLEGEDEPGESISASVFAIY